MFFKNPAYWSLVILCLVLHLVSQLVALLPSDLGSFGRIASAGGFGLLIFMGLANRLGHCFHAPEKWNDFAVGIAIPMVFVAVVVAVGMLVIGGFFMDLDLDQKMALIYHGAIPSVFLVGFLGAFIRGTANDELAMAKHRRVTQG